MAVLDSIRPTPGNPNFPSRRTGLLAGPSRRGDEQGLGPQDVLFTLDEWTQGGIRDHMGGGFHRYSTDRYWRVPHFEKMLYDNGQLASVYLAAYEITKDPRWRQEAEATFAFIEQKMTAPEGGFYSALDAETKGEEGAITSGPSDEVQGALGRAPTPRRSRAGLRALGRAEVRRRPLSCSTSRARVPSKRPRSRQRPEELEARLRPLRARLLAVREKRPAPLLDDKIITGWNGLMIAAYADGYRVLKVDRYRQAAERAASFLLEQLRTADGRLLRTFRQGKAKLPAYLEDYAFPGPRPAPAPPRDRRRALAAGSPGA